MSGSEGGCARALLLAALLLVSGVAQGAVIGGRTSLDEPVLEQARNLLARGRTVEARSLLEPYLAQHPDSATARVLLGRSLVAERPGAARDAAVAVLGSGPRNDEALDLLTVAYGLTRVEGLGEADELRLRAQEIADYTMVLERHPRWRDALFRSATRRLDLQRLLARSDPARQEGQLAAAVEELTRLVSLFDVERDPPRERASALHQLGRALRLTGDVLGQRGENPERRALFYQRAAEAQDRAFQLDPSRVDAVAELARVARVQADDAAAVEAIESRLLKVPAREGRAQLHALLGDLHFQAGRTADARRAYDSVLALGGERMEAYLGLYRLHLRLGDPRQAAAAMQSAVEAEPGFLLGHLKLGELAAARGDEAGAIGHFERALAVPPQSARVLGMEPSRSAYRNGLYYQASAWLAWLYLEHGDDPRRALAAVERAGRYRPIDPRLADTRGWIHYRLGEYARAKEILEPVAREHGDFPAVHYHLARTYAALGMRDPATKAVRRALGFDAPFRERTDAEALARELGAR